MKKLPIYTLIVAILFLSPSCKKTNDEKNYVRGMIDGQAFECTAGITANEPQPIPGSGDDPNLRLTGEWPFYTLKLMLLSERTIKTGTYTFEQSKQRSATLLNNNTDTYYAGPQGPFTPGAQLRGRGSITITEVSKKHVKGNFEFTAVSNVPAATKTVTNGEFSINRH